MPDSLVRSLRSPDLPPDEPDDAWPFHDEWEGRVYALFVPGIASGAFNLDEFRHAIERLDPELSLEATTTSAGWSPSRPCWPSPKPSNPQN